jgi:hypothetical protein
MGLNEELDFELLAADPRRLRTNVTQDVAWINAMREF